MPRHRSHSHHFSAAPSPQHWVTPYYWARHQAPDAEGLHKGMSADEAFVVIHALSKTPSHKNVHRAATAEFSSYRYQTEKDANYANYLERKQGAGYGIVSRSVSASAPNDPVVPIIFGVLVFLIVLTGCVIGSAAYESRTSGTISASARRKIGKIDRERERIQAQTATVNAKTVAEVDKIKATLQAEAKTLYLKGK